jgi:hypothetical protein
MNYYFDVTLRAQTYNIGCWAASIQMIFETAGLPGNPVSSDLFPEAKSFYDHANAPRTLRTFWESKDARDQDCDPIKKLLREVGLTEVPNQDRDTYDAHWLAVALPDCGPMFAGGTWGANQSFHAIVIHGIDTSKANPIMIKDPGPVGVGGRLKSLDFPTFNDLKARGLPIYYVRHPKGLWRRLCHGLAASQGGPP